MLWVRLSTDQAYYLEGEGASPAQSFTASACSFLPNLSPSIQGPVVESWYGMRTISGVTSIGSFSLSTGQSWWAREDDCYWSSPRIANSPGVPTSSSGVPGIIIQGLPWGHWDVCQGTAVIRSTVQREIPGRGEPFIVWIRKTHSHRELEWPCHLLGTPRCIHARRALYLGLWELWQKEKESDEL